MNADTTKKIKITLKQTCSICLDKISSADKCTTECKHTFHKTCIDTWARADCPMCRSDTGIDISDDDDDDDEMFAAQEAIWAQEVLDHIAWNAQIAAMQVANWESVLTEQIKQNI